MGDALVGFVIGAVWMFALMFTHDFSFAEFFCRNCRKREEAPDDR